MAKVVLTGNISQINGVAHSDQDSWEVITDVVKLAEITKNAMGDDSFADYSDLYEYFDIGKMEFHMANNIPMLTVTYQTNSDSNIIINEQDDSISINGDERSLDDIIDELVSYTRGQLSDGIGEGFEQNPCYCTDTHDYYISPGYPEMTVEIYND